MRARRRRAAPPRCGLKVHWPSRIRPVMSRPALPSLPTGSNERTSSYELTGPVMDDLLPGMLHLARDGGDTLTRQLTDQLRELITKGRLALGQRLPSSRQLAQSLDVSRNTVSFAIEQLAAEGYLSLSAGRRPEVAAGLSLDRRRTSSRSSRAESARIGLSSWAQGLHRANWPPVHDGRPRPFQPGLADEREFPLDAQGMAISSSKDAPRLIFVTPSHQYPTGRLMPIGRRLELLRFAEAAGASIIEDDYDGEFHYEARPIAALQGLAASPRVLYLGTFSKATYADIRFGYIVVPEALIDTFELAQRHTGMLTSTTVQDALAEFISSGAYLGHIRRMTRLYQGRRDRMLQALATEAGDRLSIEAPAGGMQLLARCQANDRQLSARLHEAGVV